MVYASSSLSVASDEDDALLLLLLSLFDLVCLSASFSTSVLPLVPLDAVDLAEVSSGAVIVVCVPVDP